MHPSRYARLCTSAGELLRAAGLMFAMRLALWAVPFPELHARLAQRKQRLMRRAPRAPMPVARVIRRVRIAQRLVPRATCLVQALAAEQLLARAGHAATLRLGVARKGRSDLDAHAWLECDGRPVLGTSPGFTPLT